MTFRAAVGNFDCVVSGFPSGHWLSKNPYRKVTFPFPELVWAATTVGRKGWRDVFRHGVYSIFEFRYRALIIYANLRLNGSRAVIKSEAYRSLDPSEKGAISYFLGLTFSKFLARRYLGVDWLMHLDMYHDELTPVIRGNRRPDLVGLNPAGESVVIESKGRTGPLTIRTVADAKAQACALRSIRGEPPVHHLASITHFTRDHRLSTHFEDPDGSDLEALNLEISEDQFLLDYYAPFVSLLEQADGPLRREQYDDRVAVVVEFEDLDLKVGLDLAVRDALRSRAEIRERLVDLLPDSEAPAKDEEFVEPNASKNYFVGSDGIAIELGPSWSDEAMLREPERRG